jgi:hypothetical protein
MNSGGIGQWHRLGPGAPTDPLRLFHHEDPAPGAGELGAGGQAIGPGTDNHRVVVRHCPLIVPDLCPRPATRRPPTRR